MAVVVKAKHKASKHNIYRVCSGMFKCALKNRDYDGHKSY